MSLSEDYRRVYSSNEPTTIPQTTLMIESANDEPVHSWTIAVSENCDWTVGLCDNRSDRGYSMGPVRGRYALCLKGDQLSYLTGADNTVIEQSVTPERMSRPESVEVSWSPASFTVSFFSRSSARYGRRLIVSLDVSRDSPPLIPFVELQSTAAHEQKAQEAYQQRQQLYYEDNYDCYDDDYPTRILTLLWEALRVASTLLQATGHLLIASAIRRIIEGAELWQPQRDHEYTANWN
ncbi:hypothetical protein NHX12_014515 [Muraenolepis orangiensis]|uniref:Uncharacterized protein n=1 Tax=Muraenolepis orangiensis TaxID=630683 RepID=A0A9Q0D8N1_9TELE|nr:hypothetical protein NHX12_014515 [Muraenolepis orangiensis]